MLAVHTTHGLGEVVLECWGEIDLSSSGALAAALETAVVEAGGRLVVDLMGVQFIDMTGVACLIRGKQRCAGLGAAFEVVAPRSGPFRRIADLLRLETELAIRWADGPAETDPTVPPVS
ncbi:MAG: STAS domain-containing protein [Gaiellales bacterium]